MAFFDKNNVLPIIALREHVELELGCGSKKQNQNAIGIDILDYSTVDIIGDVYEILASFPDKSVDAVQGYHFIEHVENVQGLLNELARIVKPKGYVKFVAPHFSSPYFYSDPTHRNFFGLYTFCYFADKSPFSRAVPTYDYNLKFNIVKVDLIFKSPYPFFIRYGIKRVIGSFFNSCSYTKELYEENFCYLFPCYEVSYLLQRQTIDA